MTIQEFEKHEELDGKIIIRVFDYKTAGSHGPANVVIEQNTFDLMTEYYSTIRQNIEPQNQRFAQRFFLTNMGFEFRKISETMQEVAKSFTILLPSTTIHRKWIDSVAHGIVDDKTMRVLNKHMAHSSATSAKFYQFQSTQNAVDTHNEIKKLTEKQHFTKDEDKAILHEYPLQQEVTPSLCICQKIVDKHSLKKGKKQIQDRWRIMKKNNSK